MQKAKQLVCLDACKRLHQLGALDDHLCPSVEELPLEISSKASICTSGAGLGTCLLSPKEISIIYICNCRAQWS